MKIYTRQGDEGYTRLATGQRVAKDHPLIQCGGDLDEVNCQIGAAISQGVTAPLDQWLSEVQQELFACGALVTWVASTAQQNSGSQGRAGEQLRRHSGVIQKAVPRLESQIDQMTLELPKLTHFILPGGTPAAAALHVARSVCRRAERAITTQVTSGVCDELASMVIYLNRLSDWLFTSARWVNFRQGGQDARWISDESQ